MKTSPIRKSSLREQVHSSLLHLLLQGRWTPGERWNDSAIAAELGVSRTPVREAMIQLEAEGLVACDLNRGFHLPALRREEAQEIYPILWSLEQLAVFLSTAPAADLRKRLEQPAPRPAGSGRAVDMAAALKHDRAWHLGLVEASANAHLMGLHQRLEAISRRYAAQLAPAAGFAERNTREHVQILDALASEQPARAHALLKMHWRTEMDAVLAAMDLRGQKSAETATPPKSQATRRAAAAGEV